MSNQRLMKAREKPATATPKRMPLPPPTYRGTGLAGGLHMRPEGPWRGAAERGGPLARLARRAAVLALAVVVGLAPGVPAQAQTINTLFVTNGNETPTNTETPSVSAQAFVTGRGADVHLYLVEIRVSSQGSSATTSDTHVTVWNSDANGEPGTLLGSFQKQVGNYQNNRFNTFAADRSFRLKRNTQYHVLVNHGITDENRRLAFSLTQGDGEQSALGWSIANERRWNSVAVPSTWVSAANVLMMRLKGLLDYPETDPTLSSLEFEDLDGNPVALDPGFEFDTFAYAASVPSGVHQITVETTLGYPPSLSSVGASFEYLDADDAAIADADDDIGGHQVALAEGDNTIKVKVTSEDGNETETYTVTVTRAARVCPIDLDGRTQIWWGDVTVGAIRDSGNQVTGYGFHKADGVGALSDETYDLGSTTGVAILSSYVETDAKLVFDVSSNLPQDDFPALRLHVCGDTFELVAAATTDGLESWAGTGLDWSSTDTVALALTASKDATLSGLALSDGTLDPEFKPDKLSYTASVLTATTRITVTPTVNDPGAIPAYLDGDDTELADADDATEGFQVDLSPGNNVVKVVVTAGDRRATETYRVNVRQVENAVLVTNLSESNTFPPTGVTAQAFTTGSHPAGYRLAQVSLRLGILQSTVIGSDTHLALWSDDGVDGVPHELLAPLISPATPQANTRNDFAVPDGTVLGPATTYHVVVNRGLSSLRRLVAQFTNSSAEASDYGWSIADERLLSPETYPTSTDWFSDTGVLRMELEGSEVPADPATLRALSVEDEYGRTVALAPEFDPGVLVYAASVTWAVREVTIKVTAGSDASVAYLDADDMPEADPDADADGHQVALAVGDTVVKAQVTDSAATQTYTVTVTRGPRACAVDLARRTEIWAGEVTVAGITAIPNTPFYAYGFSLGGGHGALLPGQRFAFGLPDPVEVSIQEVFVRTTNTAGDFVFNTLDFPETDRPALRLHVCGDTFELATSTSASGREYWPNSGLDWSSADMVSLALSASPDATLSGLSLSDGTLDPGFASDVVAYTASVSNATTRITVTPTFNVQGAIPAYLDGDDNGRTDADDATDGFQMDLVVGDNVVKVVVTSGDRQNTSTYIVTVNRGTAPTNRDPAFDDGASTSRSVDENTVSNTDIGVAVAADDPDGDTLTYTLEGTDAASFGISGTTGQLLTNVALDHEAKPAYAVTVKADDGEGGTATIPVTVNVNDVNEKSDTPAAPTVAATANTTDSLNAAWTKPGLNGGPEIVGYTLRHRPAGTTGTWTETTPSGTGTTATIGSLSEDTAYAVQVRTRNGETASDWSPSGQGSTGAGANGDPAFDDGASTSRAVDENTGSGVGFGQAVAADDPDGDTLAYTLEGTDAASFGINGATGRLRTGAALDHERKSAYAVTVKADDGEGGAATIAVTVNVGDVDEPPETPGGPRVAPVAGSATSLAAGWSEPATTGPPVSDYDLRYREPGGAWADGPRNVAGTSATLGGLSADTSYQVQVLARNAEGQSDWSASGSGRTNADDGPADLAVLTMHARAGSVPSGGLAEWELRRSGGDMDWLKMSYRMEEADGIHTTAWGYLKPGQTKKSVSKYAYARGTVVMRVTGPSQPRCTPSDAPSASCTDDYAVGSPSSASMRVTAPASSSPPDASVSGAVMTLRYAQALDAGSTPGPKDWVVRAATDAGARTLAVASVSVMGAEAVLELSPPVVAGEEVAVSYLPWAMHPLRASEGAEAAPLTELPVRNETPPTLPFEPPADDAAVVATDVADGRVAPPLGPWLSALLAERPASSLTRLDLPRRGLTDISPLAGLTGLEVLDLSGNAVADAWPLAGLSNLRRLDLSGNRIEDVSALAGLAGLEVLLLDGNGVADVLPLSQLPRLARLGLSGNRLTDVVLLADLGSIVRLDLSGNRVADASPLGDLSALVWLDLSGNPVSDVSPLGRLTALRWLWLDAGAPGLGALAPLVERPMPLRIESAVPLEIGEPH